VFDGLGVNIFDDPEFKEDSVRETIITPMLTRLGYKPYGDAKVIRSRALKHPFIRIGTRNHPVTVIPDYTLLFEDRPLFILDAKSPAEDLLKEIHVQQAYSYAVHPEVRCDEFGLCNGRCLALFHVDSHAPALVLTFDEYLSRWEEIEKRLAPKYLLNPKLRKIRPDFGTKLLGLGTKSEADLTFLGARLNLFARVDAQLFTATSNIDFAGSEHCASFDFHSDLLPQMIAGLPDPLRRLFQEALDRNPFQAAASLMIELDLTARLGDQVEVSTETFVPLVVHAVHDSRFNPVVDAEDPGDVPDHVFTLNKVVKVSK
jgi:hypothetical protein